jgi:hypothetical protein
MRVAALVLIAGVYLVPRSAAAEVCPPGRVEIHGTLDVTAAAYAICLPPNWDGRRALFYAHGTDGDTTLAGIEDQLTLPDGTRLPDVFVPLGIPFAWLARSDPGFSDIQVAIAELLALQATFASQVGSAAFSYLGGVSQGASIVTRVLEREPTAFDGAVAVCGPIGNFWRQLFRAVDIYNLLDYFLGAFLLERAHVSDTERLLTRDDAGGPAMPPSLVARVDDLAGAIVALFTAPTAPERRQIEHFLGVTRLASRAFYAANAALVGREIAGLIAEVVTNFNDAFITLGGHVYNNRSRLYLGSGRDVELNLRIQRFDPDTSTARAVIAAFYETTGALAAPLVAPHNLSDPRVPVWHEILYALKAAAAGAAALHTPLPLLRYGHCNIELPEALAAFVLLVSQVEGHEVSGVSGVLPDTPSQELFHALLSPWR